MTLMSHSAEAYFKHGQDENPLILFGAEDVDRLLEDLLSGSWENSIAALYVVGRDNAAGVPDHELLVAVDLQGKPTGALRYMGGDGTYFSDNQSGADGEVLYYYMGSDREFPVSSSIPLEVLRLAVKEFLASGGNRPASVEWQDEVS
jgi:hypothetical protein